MTQGYAVVDLRTTGINPDYAPRVVELALVLLDPSGAVEGRWDTLVHPARGLGALRSHGLGDADLRDAPRWRDLAPELFRLLSGRTIVAHHAGFEVRALRVELGRLGFLSPVGDPDVLCTQRLARRLLPGTGRSLADALRAFDLRLDATDRAAADADGTARLLAALLDEDPAAVAAACPSGERLSWPSPDPVDAEWMPRPRELTRPRPRIAETVTQLPASTPAPVSSPDWTAEDAYLALLDQEVSDGFLTAREGRFLPVLAAELGLTAEETARLHLRYFEEVVWAVWGRQEIIEDDRLDLVRVASFLDVTEAMAANAISLRGPEGGASSAPPADADGLDLRPRFRPGELTLRPGDRVALTGDLTWTRERYAHLLRSAGFVPSLAMTADVAVLVAAEPAAAGGRAAKARDYGVPVVTEEVLRAALGV